VTLILHVLQGYSMWCLIDQNQGYASGTQKPFRRPNLGLPPAFHLVVDGTPLEARFRMPNDSI